jgi:hypothetical protein
VRLWTGALEALASGEDWAPVVSFHVAAMASVPWARQGRPGRPRMAAKPCALIRQIAVTPTGC